jgi:hypothetical protein
VEQAIPVVIFDGEVDTKGIDREQREDRQKKMKKKKAEAEAEAGGNGYYSIADQTYRKKSQNCVNTERVSTVINELVS